jgi:Alr-MurF fusion protein
MENRSELTLTAAGLASRTDGVLTGAGDIPVTGIITDSRLFSLTEGLAFFAIRGLNHDGHIFIQQLYDRGIRIFVVEALPDPLTAFSEAAFVKVRNTVDALQAVAAMKRKYFTGKVIAVTGSAGKTVVKEWLADIMGSVIPVIRSPKSYNSQIGVPLSVWKLDNSYKAGIFEAGISLPGEMDRLREIIHPDIGIITNIGEAHGENFSSLKEKAEEKLRLFIRCSRIIYCSDYALIDGLVRNDSRLSGKKITTWSFSNKKADYFVDRQDTGKGQTRFRIAGKNFSGEFTVPFSDRASVENAATVAIASIVTGIDSRAIAEGLENLTPVAMRMEIKTGVNGCTLIEDYYNSDPGSLGMAVEYLAAQSNSKKGLVLSDFIQSGRSEMELYSEVALLLRRNGISRFIGIGPAISRNSGLFSDGSRFYSSTEDFLKHFPVAELKDEILLLKGARIFEFEKIGNLLERQVHQTVLEINLDAIAQNLNFFRKHLKQGTRIMAMVKAFAYGAGPAEIATLLEYHRIDYLAVANADEGVALRQAGVSVPVVVMNPEVSAFGAMIKYSLEPEIYSIRLLKQFKAAASRFGLLQYPVHIKIDTGMHRLGFLPGETAELTGIIIPGNELKIESVFSHLAASEDPAFDSFTRKQVSVFSEVSDRIADAAGHIFLRHILNSAGIIRFPEYQFDMVRPGIGLYGISPVEGKGLRQAGRYITRISQLKKIPAGEPVGYGCTDTSGEDRLIAILPVGYADGLDRRLGRRNGYLFICGKKVPLIGNISMDMCMADVTGLAVNEGDEAEIFGSNISVEELARSCGTIPYEVLTSIPSRVKRVFYRE